MTKPSFERWLYDLDLAAQRLGYASAGKRMTQQTGDAYWLAEYEANMSPAAALDYDAEQRADG